LVNYQQFSIPKLNQILKYQILKASTKKVTRTLYNRRVSNYIIEINCFKTTL
jgi:hypothetical protein